VRVTQGPKRADRIASLGYDYEAQAKSTVARCNLCGASGQDGAEVARRDRYGYGACLVICRGCGLGWLSPRMTAQSYARFYDGAYRPLVSAYHGRRIDAETVQLEQRAYATELAEFLVPLLAAQPRMILDVGGSTGVVAEVLAMRFGARATVLDPAAAELAVARSAGVETISGFAEDFDPGDRHWDLVLMCQTIDHLLDVRRSLAALRRMTAATGRAFVDILDAELMLRRSETVDQLVKIDHPFYLTRDTALAFFAVAGYTVLAERASADGHRGFVLAPAESREPDWHALAAGAARFLERPGVIAQARSRAGNL
jgi:SAM-dependent methyltransferase